MIIIEKEELENIKENIIKYLKKNYKKNENLINIIELALYVYKNEIINNNNYSDIIK